jgi:hypothetical protein
MERRKIVAAIVKIANELDSIGMYEEANQLTKVAQAAGAQFMKGLEEMGSATSRGIKGLGRDIGKGLQGTYDATKQGLSDAGELIGEGASNLGFGIVNPAAELGLGASEISSNMIEMRLQNLRDLARQNPKSADQQARALDSNIALRIENLKNMPGGGSQAAKDEVTKLMQKRVEVRKLFKKDLSGSGLPQSLRVQENQLSNTPDINDYIYNRASKRPLTRVQLYEMAKQEHGENFANSVASQLTMKGYTDRNQIVKPR